MAVVTWTCCSVQFTAADGRLTITLCGLLLGSSLLRPWGGGLNRKSVTDILWRILLSDDGLRHAARLKRKEVDFCSGGKWSKFLPRFDFWGVTAVGFCSNPRNSATSTFYALISVLGRLKLWLSAGFLLSCRSAIVTVRKGQGLLLHQLRMRKQTLGCSVREAVPDRPRME